MHMRSRALPCKECISNDNSSADVCEQLRSTYPLNTNLIRNAIILRNQLPQLHAISPTKVLVECITYSPTAPAHTDKTAMENRPFLNTPVYSYL